MSLFPTSMTDAFFPDTTVTTVFDVTFLPSLPPFIVA